MEFGPIAYPVTLISDIDELILSEKLRLKKMTEEEALEILGLRERTLHPDGTIKSYGFKTHKTQSAADSFRESNLYSSNYCFWDFDGKNRFSQQFDSALRMISIGRSGLWLGTSKSMTIYGHPTPYFDLLPITKFKKINSPEFIQFFNLLSNPSEKLKLAIERYKAAISFGPIPRENRLVDLTTVLEMIFLPESGGNELRFRLSLRIAKVFKKFLHLDAMEIFENCKQLYDARSKVVHTGKAQGLNDELLLNAIDYVHKSIRLFLATPTNFTQENLELLCIE